MALVDHLEIPDECFGHGRIVETVVRDDGVVEVNNLQGVHDDFELLLHQVIKISDLNQLPEASNNTLWECQPSSLNLLIKF